jgi:branched-chain amino acid transport system substrate-binding protein
LPIPLGPGYGLPGIRGARLTLVSADTKGQTEVATKQANEFVTVKRAAGVVIADSAEVAMTTASEMQRLRAPLLDATNTADYLTELGMDWYFRAAPGDRSMVESAFAVLRRQSVTKIAVLTEPAGDSAAGLAHIQTIASAAGIQIWHQQETSKETLDLVSGEVQAIVVWAHTAAAAAAARKMASSVPGNPPVVGLGKGFRDLAAPVGAAPMTLRTVLWSADLAGRSPAAKAVAELYQKRFGHPMTGPAAATFTAVIALAVAIDAGGSDDPAAIRAALRRTALPPTQMIMPWDGVRFASDGHNSLAASALEAWDGKDFRLVYPAELATERLRWPK